jgi:hypothetical protein
MRAFMINVYLDSSDYSVLSDPSRSSSEVESILSQLERFLEDGRIACWFSAASVAEAVPLAPTFLPAARSRLEMIKRLCGNNCLVDGSTLAAIERDAVLKRRPPLLNEVRKVDGRWTPNIDEIVDDILTPQQELQRQVTALGLGRAARRKMEHSIKKRGPQAAQSTVAEFYQRYPFRPVDRPILTAYAEGRADKAQILECLVAAFTDLEQLADWYEKRWDHTAPVFKWIRSSGALIVQNMPKLVEVFLREKQNAVNIGISEEDAIRMLDKIAVGIVSRAHRILGKQLLKIDPDAAEEPISDDDLWSWAPGISTMGAAAGHVSRRAAFVRKDPRPPKESDYGDIVHSAYMPYVDIFRADGFTADALKKLKSARATVVVSRLTELMPEIQRKIEAPQG